MMKWFSIEEAGAIFALASILVMGCGGSKSNTGTQDPGAIPVASPTTTTTTTTSTTTTTLPTTSGGPVTTTTTGTTSTTVTPVASPTN